MSAVDVLVKYAEQHGLPDDFCEAISGVAELIEALENIKRRAASHPDDDDADRKRNLYHCESIASAALARVGGGA